MIKIALAGWIDLFAPVLKGFDWFYKAGNQAACVCVLFSLSLFIIFTAKLLHLSDKACSQCCVNCSVSAVETLLVVQRGWTVVQVEKIAPAAPFVRWSPHPSIYQASLRGRSLTATGRASTPRLELPPGKPCLFSDRLGPYEISFLINPHGRDAPEMEGENKLAVCCCFSAATYNRFPCSSSQLCCEWTFTAQIKLTVLTRR